MIKKIIYILFGVILGSAGLVYAATPLLTVPQGGTGASSFTVGNCIKGNGTGALTDGTCGSGAYPFAVTGNATSTKTQFNGGLTSFASTTIGNGAAKGGLTINGGATTTGNAYFMTKVGIGTSTPTESLSIGSTANTTNRLSLQTYQDTDSIGSSELIRLYSMNHAAKATIAFYDENGIAKTWVQQHDYLHFYSTFTFAPSSVNTATDVVTIASSGYVTGWQVQFSTTGTLPGGLSAATNYYVRVSGSSLTFYDTTAHATSGGATGLIDLTSQGTGTHTITPDNTYNNNVHQHFSIESADSTGAKQTRLSIPYGFDTTEMGIFSSNLNVNNGVLRINGDSTSNKTIDFGNALSNNLTPDLTNIRWSLQQNNTTETGSNVGSDFRITRYSDTGVALDSPFFIKRSNGNIGLGTTTPTGKLQIYAAAPKLFISDSGGGTNLKHRYIQSSGGSLIFGKTSDALSSTNQIWIDTNGRLGVATATPYALLSVNPNGIGTAPAFVIGSSTKTVFKVDNAGNLTLGNITGSTQCLHVDTNGKITGTGSDCGGAGSSPGGSEGQLQYNHSSAFTGAANLYFINSTGFFGIGTSSPNTAFTVGSSTAINIAEYKYGAGATATSTTMYIGMASSSNQLIRLGTSATTLKISKYHLYAGEHITVTTCTGGSAGNASNAWSNLHYSGGVAPGFTTTANQCDMWFIVATQATSSVEAVLTGMTPGIQ